MIRDSHFLTTEVTSTYSKRDWLAAVRVLCTLRTAQGGGDTMDTVMAFHVSFYHYSAVRVIQPRDPILTKL